MDSIKVTKSDLLTKLRANRETHRKVFLAAQAGYRKKVIEELDKMLAEARAGKRFRTSVHLVSPVDQTAEYDAAIEMLEMSVETEIELSAQDFRQFVRDDWGWKRQFTASNSVYLADASDDIKAAGGFASQEEQE